MRPANAKSSSHRIQAVEQDRRLIRGDIPVIIIDKSGVMEQYDCDKSRDFSGLFVMDITFLPGRSKHPPFRRADLRSTVITYREIICSISVDIARLIY